MIGKILGKRYEITEEIAQGGMSVVYKALDLNLNRYDAIKVLNEEFASDKEILERFKQEANAVAFLSHPNIVNIYNVGSEGNIHYIVMEYVKGRTLKEIINLKGHLSNEETLNYSYQMARALESAHNSNIIHRDIKPQNIIITKDGLVKVTDFGIAKHSDSATITNSGKIIGSAHYFSPEQARGNMTDRRSDIYSLGITMYEMVTGSVPFDAESPITIALKHMQENLPSPRKLNPKVSEGLEKVIMRATEKNPIERYQKIEDMMSDLRALMNGGEISPNTASSDHGSTQVMGAVLPENELIAESDDMIDDPKPKNSKKKALIVGLAMILVVVLGAFVGDLVFGGKSNTPPVAEEEDVTIPTLVDLSKEHAEALLKEKGLILEVQGKEPSDKPVDTVIKSVPEEGQVVKKGSTVAVILSSGEEGKLVPDILGVSLDTARIILENNGFKVGLVEEEHDEMVPQGDIITQDPRANTTLPKGSTVDVLISKGPALKVVNVPSLIGKTEREAKGILESKGLSLGEITKAPTGDEAQSGRIVEQNIPANTEVKAGSKVSVTIYEYREVTIPTGLTGKNVVTVYNQLKALGLNPKYGPGIQNNYLVLEVSPGEGRIVPYGSTVIIEGDLLPEEPVQPEEPVAPEVPQTPGN